MNKLIKFSSVSINPEQIQYLTPVLLGYERSPKTEIVFLTGTAVVDGTLEYITDLINSHIS